MSNTHHKEVTSQLKSNLLFNSLDAKSFKQLLKDVMLDSLDEDEVLFKQNDLANSIFLLETGLIKLVRRSTAGKEKIVEIILPGQSFAEAVMFSDEGGYPVSAVALCESQAWRIDSRSYKKILYGKPDACFSVMAALSRRLHHMIAEIDYLTLHSATVRLVAFLVNQAGDAKTKHIIVELPYTKVVLASLLSIKAETLSRSFAKLSKEKLINIEERRITILDLQGLKQLLLTE